jgi:hypothetical protein
MVQVELQELQVTQELQVHQELQELTVQMVHQD